MPSSTDRQAGRRDNPPLSRSPLRTILPSPDKAIAVLSKPNAVTRGLFGLQAGLGCRLHEEQHGRAPLTDNSAVFRQGRIACRTRSSYPRAKRTIEGEEPRAQ